MSAGAAYASGIEVKCKLIVLISAIFFFITKESFTLSAKSVHHVTSYRGNSRGPQMSRVYEGVIKAWPQASHLTAVVQGFH